MSVETATRLQTLLADYPNTLAIKQGVVSSPLIEFAFAAQTVANEGFKPLVREARFDLGELAIVTYLQAKQWGKPYVLMPVVVVGRDQHHTLFYNSDRGTLTPADLKGKRVGVRAYSQTTGGWLRGILKHEYGVDAADIKWITYEDPHVAEYVDPVGIERAPAGKSPQAMLLAGEIDAAILGEVAGDPRLKTVIPDARQAARDWTRQHDAVPVNHMLVIRQELSRARPDLLQEIVRLFAESKRQGAKPADTERDSIPMGVEPNRKSLELIIAYSFEQGLINRRFTVDELFDDNTRKLGA
jgi:4,5-dihydroxyphthalate decarboxylase